MIGNVEDAKTAMALGKAMEYHNLPDGWEYLDAGSSRVVYAKGNVVYKYFTGNESYDDYDCNEIEFRYSWWLRGQDLPGDYIIPTTWYFPEQNILAMERVDHDRRLTSQKVTDWFFDEWFHLGNSDIGSHNAAWVDGMIVVIDLGYCSTELFEFLPETLDILS